jgi:hypothetical protein
VAREDFSHPLRAYGRLRGWYKNLPAEDRKRYRRSRICIELATVLAILAFGILAAVVNSPIPLLGILLAAALSALWTRRIRREFGFKG